MFLSQPTYLPVYLLVYLPVSICLPIYLYHLYLYASLSPTLPLPPHKPSWSRLTNILSQPLPSDQHTPSAKTSSVSKMNKFRERGGVTVNYGNISKDNKNAAKNYRQINLTIGEMGKFLERHKRPKSPEEAMSSWHYCSAARVLSEHA